MAVSGIDEFRGARLRGEKVAELRAAPLIRSLSRTIED
jgi:hypothetical protein